MKTKEEQASEYAEITSFRVPYNRNTTIFYDEKIFNCAKNAFLTGIEFAEQWISVEDELPENNGSGFSDEVLIQTEDGYITIGYYRYSKMQWEILNYIDEVKFWRPINVK